jgi:hypothetical protein
MRSIGTTNRSRGALKRLWLQLPYSQRLEYAVALPKLRVWAAERADGVLVFMTRRELYADVGRRRAPLGLPGGWRSSIRA